MTLIQHTSDLQKLPFTFFLFSYGANNIENLARRCFGNPFSEPSKEDIRHVSKVSYRWICSGYQRSFFGYSDRWKGSVATIHRVSCKNLYVTGVLTQIQHIYDKKEECSRFFVHGERISFENLCHIESLNEEMYRLECIGSSSEDIPIYAFIGNHESQEEHPTLKYPSLAYQKAILRTHSDALTLNRLK
jgi:hypothetical protein